MRSTRLPWLLLSPTIIILIFTGLLPFFYVLYVGFFDWNIFSATGEMSYSAANNYRKLVRLGAYGSFLNQYLCGLSFRVSDLQGRTAYFPWIVQHTGRCAEP